MVNWHSVAYSLSYAEIVKNSLRQRAGERQRMFATVTGRNPAFAFHLAHCREACERRQHRTL